jgi:hypothetical protein
MAGAASWTSRKIESAIEALAGLMSHGDTNSFGHHVMKESEPLGCHLRAEEVDAGHVAARPGEAGDKTKLDRVEGDAEDNRNRRCCSLRRERRHVARRSDDRDLSANEIGQQSWEPVVLALQPVVFDLYVLALDIAAFVEAPAECGHMMRGAIRRVVPDKPDHRQRLLCAHRERPSGCRADQERDELAPPQLIGPHVPPRFEDRTASYPKWRIAVRGSVTYFAVHQVLRFE